MMLVRTSLRPSRIHGLGVFAAEPIQKGTAIWQFESRLDITVPSAVLVRLPTLAQSYLRWFAYLNPDSDCYVLCFDNAKYFNHSSNPNTRASGLLYGGEGVDLAARDIAVGEELTTDYREFDADALSKLELRGRGWGDVLEMNDLKQTH